jgi:beta-aspartyl-peptidase (threonine type)
MSYAIAIHGGAGKLQKTAYNAKQLRNYKSVLKQSLEAGSQVLEKGGAAIDAVVESVIVLENTPEFNAGVGGVFCSNGIIEHDACLMDGESLMVGGVTCVHRVKNPILAAQEVMNHSPHCLLSGDGAELFAYEQKLELVSNKFFHTKKRYDQFRKLNGRLSLDHSQGTVGAVARDLKGNLAAATSTGGMTNKAYGRVSDTSILGAGNYANNKTCAISATGTGDQFMKTVFCYEVSSQMELGGRSLAESGRIALEKLKNVNGYGGFVAIDKNGNVVIDFNCSGMFRALKTKDKCHVAIFKGE